MKRIFALALVAVLLLSMISCDIFVSDRPVELVDPATPAQTTPSTSAPVGGNGSGNGNSDNGSGNGDVSTKPTPVYPSNISAQDKEIHGKYWNVLYSIIDGATFDLDYTYDYDERYLYEYRVDVNGSVYVKKTNSMDYYDQTEGYQVGDSYYDKNGATSSNIGSVIAELKGFVKVCTDPDQYGELKDVIFTPNDDEYGLNFKYGGKSYICSFSADGTWLRVDILNGSVMKEYLFTNISVTKVQAFVIPGVQ